MHYQVLLNIEVNLKQYVGLPIVKQVYKILICISVLIYFTYPVLKNVLIHIYLCKVMLCF